MVEFEYPVLRDEDGIEVEHVLRVRGSYVPETPGRTSGHPDTWYPAEGGEAEIECALSRSGIDFDPHLLTKDERSSILDQIRYEAEAILASDYESYCESRADAYDDRLGASPLRSMAQALH